MTPEQKRYYQQGYRAGRRRAREDDLTRMKREITAQLRREVREDRHEALVERLFAAVIAGSSARTGWKLGEKPVHTTEDYIELARAQARTLMGDR